MNFRDRFYRHLQQGPFFKSGETVFVACSGGPDSVALYFLLKKLSADLKIKLGLIHFNHGLRGKSSNADALFVKKLALKNKDIFIGGKAAKKYTAESHQSLEEWARFERYGFFKTAFRKGRGVKILTAHTLDDQAETVLMRVVQGTGLQGLSGIRREMKMGPLTFIRPLLDFSKKEILDFLKQNRISYRKDASNRSTRFLRNRLRLDLIPRLEKQYNPRIKETLARIPQILEEETVLLQSLKEKAWQQCFRRKTRGQVQLHRGHFLKLPVCLKFSVLDKALKALHSESGMSFDAWQRIKNGLKKGAYRQSLPKDLDFELTSSTALIYKKKNAP